MEKGSLSLSLQVLTVAAWNWLLKVMRTYSVVLFVLFTWIITPTLIAGFQCHAIQNRSK